ncbi:MAG TPA: hypothetical protein IAB26_03190, partial [Candidatus Limivivens merdigallinarum]|nr:hypothetical protein [Candidatus Limivivens merdigallinarum]
TEITKRDILDLFRNGLEINEFFDTKTVIYHYFGRIEEIAFLKRIYDLGNMPSVESEKMISDKNVENQNRLKMTLSHDKMFR